MTVCKQSLKALFVVLFFGFSFEFNSPIFFYCLFVNVYQHHCSWISAQLILVSLSQGLIFAGNYTIIWPPDMNKHKRLLLFLDSISLFDKCAPHSIMYSPCHQEIFLATLLNNSSPLHVKTCIHWNILDWISAGKNWPLFWIYKTKWSCNDKLKGNTKYSLLSLQSMK